MATVDCSNASTIFNFHASHAWLLSDDSIVWSLPSSFEATFSRLFPFQHILSCSTVDMNLVYITTSKGLYCSQITGKLWALPFDCDSATFQTPNNRFFSHLFLQLFLIFLNFVFLPWLFFSTFFTFYFLLAESVKWGVGSSALERIRFDFENISSS